MCFPFDDHGRDLIAIFSRLFPVFRFPVNNVNISIVLFRYPQPPLQDRLPKGGKLLNDIPGAEGIEFGTLGLYRLESMERPTQKVGNQDDVDGVFACRRVHCLSNPCTFQINELVFGVTSTDVLFHVSAEETNANLHPGSRLRRIAQHLIQQESYYPLFPPNKAVNLDLNHLEGWKMPCRPDVLIVPSKLTPFCAPVLESTIVVNPGHLAKGTTGGTYAILEIPPIPRETLDEAVDSVLLPHNIQDRIQVYVKRI
jgi:DNA polymerase alpha subunit B